jgi:esterase/lipase
MAELTKVNRHNNIIHLRDTFYRAFMNPLRFNEKLFSTFSEAYSVYIKTIFEGNNVTKDVREFEKILRSKMHNIFDARFREEDFVNTLSETVASYPHYITAPFLNIVAQKDDLVPRDSSLALNDAIGSKDKSMWLTKLTCYTTVD